MNSYFDQQLEASTITEESAKKLLKKDATLHVGEHILYYLLESQTKNGLTHVDVLSMYSSELDTFLTTHTFIRYAGVYDKPLPIFKPRV